MGFDGQSLNIKLHGGTMHTYIALYHYNVDLMHKSTDPAKRAVYEAEAKKYWRLIEREVNHER